ncbi:forkhead box protein P1-like isoform X2 [Centruroides vittatus]|uniref:forkhead box protein P1-like isoform X2 n=1 Tax=Centruroides vittatus TaxID=120091 RepID=UPI0035101D4A
MRPRSDSPDFPVRDTVIHTVTHPLENEAMMDHEETGESAINLSTNHTTRSASSPTPNGSVDVKNGDVQTSKPQRSKLSHSLSDGSSLLSLSPSLLMMNPQLLVRQQMQQLLQQQVLSPTQIQQLLHQQQSLFLQQQQQQQQLKQLESMIPHLQEQLQLNMVQQTQILQQLNSATSGSGEKVNNRHQLQVQLQQLAVQQHQLMQQIQLGHQQYFLGLSPNDLQNFWKEGNGNQEENGAKLTGLNGLLHSPPLISNQTSTSSQAVNGQTDVSTSFNQPSSSISTLKEEVNSASSPSKHPLYGHGVCRWPGCETVCDTQQAFLKHLNTEHQLDDRSTAQARVQMQVVSQLELQLSKEKERLQAMMQHLHMTQPSPSNNNSSTSKTDTPATSSAKVSRLSPQLSTIASSSSSPSLSAAVTTMSTSTAIVPVPRLLPQVLQPPAPSNVGPMRRRLGDKNYSPISGLDVPLLPDSPIRRRVAERSNLDINEEINRNREFYRTADVRPPFTYASLIRQAIVEAPDKQLTLNEIYNWFQNTFCYFRRNAATWKNAVRHNLSLHKCFMRVENVKGAVWTVDEIEFYKRRPQRIQERITGSLSQSQETPNQVGSPPLHHNPGLYGDSLNASLQAALAENNMSFLNNTTNSSSLMSGSLLTLASTSSPNPAFIESDCLGTDMMNQNATNEKISSTEIEVKQEPLSNDPNDSDNGKSHYFTDDSQQEETKCQSSEASGDMDVAEDLSLSSSETHLAPCPRGGCL